MNYLQLCCITITGCVVALTTVYITIQVNKHRWETRKLMEIYDLKMEVKSGREFCMRLILELQDEVKAIPTMRTQINELLMDIEFKNRNEIPKEQ